jgi:hypothetical protein
MGRERAALTQKAVAEAQGWSLSKVVRIEQGTNQVSPSDVRALLSLFNEQDQSVVEDLVRLAHEARGESAWEKYADVHSSAALDLFANEWAAQTIVKHEPVLIPGLLQTDDYARAVLRSFGNSEAAVRRKLEARVARQQLLDADVRPQLSFLLGEAAISTPPVSIAEGGGPIMAAQLEQLVDLAKLKGNEIHILPFSAGVHPSTGQAFTVLQFADVTLDDLLYLEDAGRESTSRDQPDEIKKYLDRFVDLQARAVPAEDFEDFLREVSRRCFPPAR